MNHLLQVIESIAPLFVFAACGYWLYFSKALRNPHLDALIRFTNDICVPAIFIRLIPKASLPTTTTYSLIVIYSLLIFVIFFIVFFISRKRVQQSEHATLWAFSAIFSNTFMLGVPLAIYTFGESNAVAYLVIVSIDILLVFSFIIFLLEANQMPADILLHKKIWLLFYKVLKHPIIAGILIGIVLNFTDFKIPSLLDSIFLNLQNMNAPLAIMAFGATIARFGIRSHLAASIVISLVKLVVVPISVLFAIILLGDVPKIWAQSLLLMSALPIGISVFVFASRYQTGRDFAATNVFVSSIISPVTLIAFLYLFENWHLVAS